jgi:lipopolysaccharide export LptBFGC system permease protein LptF
MRYWIFTLFGLAGILGGSYILYLQWDVLKPLLLIFLGFFLLLLGISLLSGPRFVIANQHR